jgi:hypothetical protein
MRNLITAGLTVFTALSVVIPASPAMSQDSKGSPQATIASPVYKPPLRGAPGGRVGGGTRGTGGGRDVFVLSALAPDHMGLTASEQPTLYWFLSSPTTLPVEVTIIDPQGTSPLYENRLTSPIAAGVHKLDLKQLGVRLAAGIPYRWSVAVVPDAKRRSRDILAAATIERVENPESLRDKLAQARADQAATLYAEAGLWYDALNAITEQLDRAPDNTTFRQQRAALLAQVGLPTIDDSKP